MPRFNQGYARSAELTREQVKEIQIRHNKGEGQKGLAKEFKVSRKRMQAIISGRHELAKWGEIL